MSLVNEKVSNPILGIGTVKSHDERNLFVSFGENTENVRFIIPYSIIEGDVTFENKALQVSLVSDYFKARAAKEEEIIKKHEEEFKTEAIQIARTNIINPEYVIKCFDRYKAKKCEDENVIKIFNEIWEHAVSLGLTQNLYNKPEIYYIHHKTTMGLSKRCDYPIVYPDAPHFFAIGLNDIFKESKKNFTEVLIHELAHVIDDNEHEHGARWEVTANKIGEKYGIKARKLYSSCFIN